MYGGDSANFEWFKSFQDDGLHYNQQKPSTIIKAIEYAAVVYGGHEPRAFVILKATPFSIDYTKQNFHQVLTQRKSQHATMPRRYFSTIGANRYP